MVHFKLNLPKTRHLFLCNLKWYHFLPHPLPFIRCCVSLTILNIRSKSVQRGIQSSVQREAINRSIWWHCSELAAVRVKWKLHIVKRQQRSDFTPWYSGTVAVYDAVGKGVRQLKVFRSHPPPMAALSLDQFMWMMTMMMVVMTIDDSDDLYSRTCMSVCSLPISSSLGARTASEIFCQITQFKEQPSSSPSSSS